MDKMSIEDVVHIRILVLALGEARHFSWWRSEFLSTTGISYLARLFPRGRFSGAIQATARAAIELHDTAIGKGNVYHLFRLPGSMEYAINSFISTRSSELETAYLPILNVQQDLLENLSKFIYKKETYKAGPTQIDEEMAANKMASAYLWAFQNSKQVFPYFLHKE